MTQLTHRGSEAQPTRFSAGIEPDLFDDRTILVTGGTGSFGRSFCKVVLQRYKPRKLIVLSRDELKQFEMQNDGFFSQHASVMRYFIGDVRDRERLEMAFRGVDYVVHAAALKHISVAEYNPFECIRTNVHGAENIVVAATKAGVKRVVALSTDKAANPINLYGASKLASDKIFVAARNLVGQGNPMFGVVRYGNVIGSRGSVIPFYHQLINNGERELPITDSRMTRFWITLEEGVDFVLSCFSLLVGGEIFVPKIPSMKITDLAHTMAPDLKTKVVGIRPGEKLHETMITEDDARTTTELADRFVIFPAMYQHGRAAIEAGSRLPEGFVYASNTNTDWLTHDQLTTILEGIAMGPGPIAER
jgi:UDP-N-acetylglucosamine 4,6-dehydratase/5-epimerase